MSRIDCISNRNTKIIANYVESKLGHCDTLFDGLPYPETRYPSPAEFFHNEDEWITYETYKALATRASQTPPGMIDFRHRCRVRGSRPARGSR